MKITVAFLSTFLFFNSILYSQILPSDLQWNDDETGYYKIKQNNIILVSVTGEKDTTILSSKVLGKSRLNPLIFQKIKIKYYYLLMQKRFGDTKPEVITLYLI